MKKVNFIDSKETYPLRLSVLWHHFDSLEQCNLAIDSLEETFHVGAFLNNEIVAIGTFTAQKNDAFSNEKQYRLRAMASSPKVREKGFGKMIIHFALAELQKRNVAILWCNARKVAFGFYEKLGFKTIGDFYDIPKIGPHKLMYFILKK